MHIYIYISVLLLKEVQFAFWIHLQKKTCCSNPYIANLHLHKSLESANSGLFWDPRWANTIHGLFWDLATCYSWCLYLLRHIGAEQNPTENGKWRNSQGSWKRYKWSFFDAYPEILHIISRVISATQKSCILAASCGPPHPMKLQIWVWLTKARDERCQPNGYARFIKYWPNIDCQTNTEKWTIRGCLLSEWRNSYLTGIKKPDQSFPRNVSKHRFANVRWLQKRKSYVPNGDVP